MHEVATGLNRCAIYERFGGKEELFYAALDYYVDEPVEQRLLGPLLNGNPTLHEVHALLDFMRNESLRPDAPAGCLIINASLEMGGRDERVERVVERFSSCLKRAFARGLSGSQQGGQLAPGRSVDERADYLVTMVNAFMVLAHVSRTSADRLMREVLAEVGSWSVPRREQVAS